MKRISVLAMALFSISLARSGVAQSVGAPVNTDSSSQSKQVKKDQKAKAKSTKPPIKAETGKKTSTSQDAAYALANKHGSTETSSPTPK
jgi:hypothetical protein